MNPIKTLYAMGYKNANNDKNSREQLILKKCKGPA
jgi:hypothetical protein